VKIASVSEDFWAMTGARAELGQLPSTREPALVLSRSYYERHFGGDPSVIGQTLTLGEHRAPVVGVLPRDFQVDLVEPTASWEQPARKNVDIYLEYSDLNRKPEPEIFEDYHHGTPWVINFVARIHGDLAPATAAFRSIASGVDPSQPPADVKTVEAVLSESIAPRRFTMVLIATFAGFALLLALIGVYGVIACSFSLRTTEIGVRMALGAERRAVLWMVMRQGLTMAAAGLLAGLVLAVAATRVMSSLLYEVTPTDTTTFSTVSIVMLVTIALASLVPAVRAASVDSLSSLRTE
jgi:hypothetical protein